MATSPLDILVIEDDPDARENLRDILELDDHRVELAGSAAEARARDDWWRFAAVILDRRLPDTTADQFLPVLKASAPQAAVIVVTGYSDLQSVITALRQGASDYLLKPLNPDLLRASLKRIAEHRRLTLAKERSDAAFRQLVEAAECMIVILRLDHTIVYFSPFAEQITGLSASDVIGRNYLDLLPESEHRTVAAEFTRVATGQPLRGFESPIACRDGSFRSILWNARYLTDYEDGPAILKVGQDITFLKQAQERALQTERLAAIGEMVTGLAHESRNALQRSQACLEMLTLAVRDRPEAISLIDRLQKAQDHLHTLYEDVRGYAAPIKLDRAACDLRQVWREAWIHLDSARAAKDASLAEAVDRVNLRCVADPFRLGQVFRNILDNALAAGSPPVAVEVLAQDADLHGRPAVHIAFRDNGPGIPPEVRPRVFDPFYTTKARGTGLGMPIARRIIEAHGGRIGLGDGDAPGATIIITLPRGTL
ncbi:MAG: two-component system sensor histidine kinase NtrB [Isosphaeraceae bacterium]